MSKVSNTVETVARENLCVSCGICSVVCPKKCIQYQYESTHGMYKPVIDWETCIGCGACYGICPGRGMDYPKQYGESDTEKKTDYFTGLILKGLRCVVKDKEQLLNSSSGGFVTAAIKALLEDGSYHAAFLVDTDQFDSWVQTKRYTADDDLMKTSKSRYIPVSQKNTVEYMIAHPQERLILVGTGCFVHAVLKIIEKYHLQREQYLIIGLFCNYTLNYKVYEYFKKHSGLDQEMDGMFFRKKELRQDKYVDRVVLKDKAGQEVSMPRSERREVVEMFTSESCLYCLDKLNQFADISVGDDYTKEGMKAEAGCSSVLIRTKQGQEAWTRISELFDFCEVDVDEIIASQGIKQRRQRLQYAYLKESEALVYSLESKPIRYEDRKSYREKLKKQAIGNSGDYSRIRAEVERVRKKKNNRFTRIKISIKYKIKGLLKRMKKIIRGNES